MCCKISLQNSQRVKETSRKAEWSESLVSLEARVQDNKAPEYCNMYRMFIWMFIWNVHLPIVCVCVRACVRPPYDREISFLELIRLTFNRAATWKCAGRGSNKCVVLGRGNVLGKLSSWPAFTSRTATGWWPREFLAHRGYFRNKNKQIFGIWQTLYSHCNR